MAIRYFYNSKTERVETYPESCQICGSYDCDCHAVVVDALNKAISQLGKELGVSNGTIRKYIKNLYTR